MCASDVLVHQDGSQRKKDQSNTLHEAQQRATNIDNNQDLPPTGKIIKIIKIIL